MKRLLVACDDCGLSEGINLAALALHRRGMAHCASVLANFPATAHALDLFRAAPSFGVGVHLNLTDGMPLTKPSPQAGLTRRDGRFIAMPLLVSRAVLPTNRFLAAIDTELRAQIERIAAAGLPLHHLSTHLQFHLMPSLRRMTLALAQTYAVPWVRPWQLRATVVPVNPWLDRRLDAGDRMPDYLAVVKYWLGLRPSALAQALNRVPGSVELVMHPASLGDPSFPSGVAYLPRVRMAEMAYLERLWPLLASTVQPRAP